MARGVTDELNSSESLDILRAMHYICRTPTRPLADFVERFWCLSDAPAHSKERIAPSGTIDLVINLGRLYVRRSYDACWHD